MFDTMDESRVFVMMQIFVYFEVRTRIYNQYKQFIYIICGYKKFHTDSKVKTLHCFVLVKQ